MGAIYARLYGGCLLLIALVTGRAAASASSPVRRFVAQAMLFQQLLGGAISLAFPFALVRWFSLGTFAVFGIGYAWILFLRGEDV